MIPRSFDAINARAAKHDMRRRHTVRRPGNVDIWSDASMLTSDIAVIDNDGDDDDDKQRDDRCVMKGKRWQRKELENRKARKRTGGQPRAMARMDPDVALPRRLLAESTEDSVSGDMRRLPLAGVITTFPTHARGAQAAVTASHVICGHAPKESSGRRRLR